MLLGEVRLVLEGVLDDMVDSLVVICLERRSFFDSQVQKKNAVPHLLCVHGTGRMCAE